MNLKEELKKVGFVMKRAVGGGGNRGALARELNWCVERSRCKDAKRQSLLQAAGQLGSEAVKLFVVVEFVKLFGLLTKRKLSTLAPMGRESNCSSATSYSCERGVQKIKNSDRATECAMTNVGEDLLKTPVGCAYQPNNET